MNTASTKSIRYLVQAAVIAAIYAVLTLLASSLNLAYGPVQFRISEFLTVLPMFTPAAIPGLTLGCFLANLASPFGPVDWIFGSVATLLAAVVSYLLRNVRIKDIPFLVPMAPVLFNALVVGVELACFSDVGFGFQNLIAARLVSWVAFGYNALTVGAGELVICYALGLPFAVFLLKTSLAKKIFLMRN